LKTEEAIIELGRTVLPHPPYIPDLIPSDCHLSEDAIRGKSFRSDDEFSEEKKK
jgi:hypothetical protein